MAMNPMQRKANNSFLLGILITLLITGAIIAFLIVQLSKLNTEKKELEASMKDVYVLASDIKSGDLLTTSKLEKIKVDGKTIPSDAITIANITETTMSKIDLKKGTIVTSNMIGDTDEKTTTDLRIQEYNMLVLTSQIETNEFVDIRLRMPSGLDYIVVSKKRVEIPEIGGTPSENSIWVKLTEDETLAMSNAIVEAYMAKGSVLYVTTYVEPGMQDKATPTYVPNANVQTLMNQNPNIVQEAKNALFSRYNGNVNQRNNINGELAAQSEESTDNLQEKVEEEIANAKEQRQKYLEILSGE